MNVKPLVLAGAATGVSVVTFVALSLIAPISHAEKSTAQGLSADKVFAASIDAPGASSPEPVVVAATEVALADTGNAPASTAQSEPAPAAMEVAQADVSEPVDTGAEAPTAAEPASGGGSCTTGIVDPKAKPVVVKATGLPGDSPAPKTAAAAPASEPAPAAPAPESMTSEPAAPRFESSPESEVAEAPKPVAKPKPRAPKKAPAEAKVAWWPAKTPGKLNLAYAGEASFTKAIVLMFDGAFDNADSANQHIKVTPQKGGAVKGKWLLATGNKQMLLLDVAPGLYTVEIGEGLTDKGNRSLGAASSGAVFIH